MKMQLLIHILFLFPFFTYMPLNAEEKLNELFSKEKSDEETKKELKQITKVFSDTHLVRAKFLQTKQIKGLKKPLISEGNFFYAKDKGLFFETLKPFEQLTVLTPKSLIQKDSSGLVSIIASDAHPALKNSITTFLSVFSGEAEILLKNYEVYSQYNQDSWQIGLIPKNKSVGNEFIVRLRFSGDIFLKTILIDEKEGNTTTIQFSDHQITPKELTKNEQFNFEQK